jgi:hypothetical protein
VSGKHQIHPSPSTADVTDVATETVPVATPKDMAPDQRRLLDRFGVDTRALAVVRVGLATIMLVEWFTRPLPDLALAAVPVARWLTLPLAILLLAGYRTRLTTVLAWLVYGIPVRADLLDPGAAVQLGRYTLVLVLFWSMFLPMGDHLSWDARRRGIRGPRFILSVASAGLLMQFFIMYFWAGATKNIKEWIIDRTALEAVLAHPYFGSPVGHAMVAFPTLLALGSVAVVLLEIAGPILLFLPARGVAARRVVLVGMFAAFHLGMAVFMSIQFFPYVMMVSWLVFLPPPVWDRVFRRGRPPVPELDRRLFRNVAAGAALAYVWLSSIVTWLFYPAQEGLPALIKEIGVYLLLYQQWAMFSMPSTL